MRKTTTILAVFAALVAIACGAVIYWRRNPRLGTTFVNSAVNPGLLRRGLAGGAKSEIGTIEHVGRRSGVRRLTPVHPEPTADGFRIIVPLGAHSEWARNVLAAGHSRLQLHGVVYDLVEPTIVRPSEVDDLPGPVRLAAAGLGFQYLKLRTFAANPGALEPLVGSAVVAADTAPVPEAMPAQLLRA